MSLISCRPTNRASDNAPSIVPSLHTCLEENPLSLCVFARIRDRCRTTRVAHNPRCLACGLWRCRTSPSSHTSPTVVSASSTPRPCTASFVISAALYRSHRVRPQAMRRSWTRRRSSFCGRCLVRYGCEVRRQLLTTRCSLHSGLILASSYLSTATPIEYSFALDKPLHTICVVLLLTGLLIVAVEAWPGRPHQPQLPARYVAIPLSNGHSRQHAEQHWTEAGLVGRKKSWSVKAVGALLAVLLFAICGRIGVFYRVMKDVECSGPTALVHIDVALYATVY